MLIAAPKTSECINHEIVTRMLSNEEFASLEFSNTNGDAVSSEDAIKGFMEPCKVVRITADSDVEFYRTVLKPDVLMVRLPKGWDSKKEKLPPPKP